ncbi:MAG: hypothetical protein AAFV01_05935, partial [Bacteroidota bacterium]
EFVRVGLATDSAEEERHRPGKFDRRIALLEQEAKGVKRISASREWAPLRSQEAYMRIIQPLWEPMEAIARSVSRLFMDQELSITIYEGNDLSRDYSVGKYGYDDLFDAFILGESGLWSYFEIQWYFERHILDNNALMSLGYSLEMSGNYFTFSVDPYINPMIYLKKGDAILGYDTLSSLHFVETLASSVKNSVFHRLSQLQDKALERLG